jgi:hypothetical protein
MKKIVRARDHADVMKLLRSHNWKVMEQAVNYLGCLDTAKLGELLSPVIESSTDSLELLSVVWISRGQPVSAAARARMLRLVNSKQDALAAAAARWFGGADDISDEELQAVWQAGEKTPLDSSFYQAALELVKRPDIGARLVEQARKAMQAPFEAKRARHALAAAVLTGRATPDDLAQALDKLTAARRTTAQASQLTAMFKGCSKLNDDTMKKFAKRLFDSDAKIRSIYLEALRQCDKQLKLKIANDAINGHGQTKEDADVSLPKHAAFARIALKGILAGAGDVDALDEIIKAVEGDDADLAKAGGGAYADAFSGDSLFRALEELNGRMDVPNAAVAALQGYIAICRRAAREKDRVTFRKAYGIAINMQLLNRNYQLRQEIMNLQSMMSTVDAKDHPDELLPRDPILTKLVVEVK